MSDNSAIEWTDATWNPVTGCTKVSPGCDHCYAERIVERFHGKGSFAKVTLHEDRLEQPLRWRKPRRIFVNSMADLFHDDVPDLFITKVFDVMERAKQHTFQVLTKRHARMRSFLMAREQRWVEYAAKFDHCPTEAMRNSPAARGARKRAVTPPANIWIGVSVEDQKWADIRIPALLNTPAAVRFLSCEPLLGPVNLRNCDGLDAVDYLDWVIVGGESGHDARPMHPDWARSLRDQTAEVPFFFKQHGEWIEADRDTATHLLHVNGSLVDRENATMDHPYGLSSGRDQDLVDRGHLGWVRVRRLSKKLAGRQLDGRTWDEYPQAVTHA